MSLLLLRIRVMIGAYCSQRCNPGSDRGGPVGRDRRAQADPVAEAAPGGEFEYLAAREAARLEVRLARWAGGHLAEHGIAGSFHPRCFAAEFERFAEQLARALWIFRSRV